MLHIAFAFLQDDWHTNRLGCSALTYEESLAVGTGRNDPGRHPNTVNTAWKEQKWEQ